MFPTIYSFLPWLFLIKHTKSMFNINKNQTRNSIFMYLYRFNPPKWGIENKQLWILFCLYFSVEYHCTHTPTGFSKSFCQASSYNFLFSKNYRKVTFLKRVRKYFLWNTTISVNLWKLKLLTFNWKKTPPKPHKNKLTHFFLFEIVWPAL